MNTAYLPRRQATTRHVPARGLDHLVHVWEPAGTPQGPLLVLLHGWMDVGASFQFVVDALGETEGPVRRIAAPDLRGFGGTLCPGADSYWFPDYLGDLDALLDALSPDAPVDLVGHSMGGNVVMTYAGVRPQRVRRLVNLEGFGLPASRPEQAPGRMAQWLEELKAPQALRDYASLEEVAARLRRNNPRLDAGHAAWLAPHWARQAQDGRWRILGDPAHKRVNPVLYRAEEALATWRCIGAPLLWVEGEDTDIGAWWSGRYTREEFETRLAVVREVHRRKLPDCGHMLHHDQPGLLAQALAGFLTLP